MKNKKSIELNIQYIYKLKRIIYYAPQANKPSRCPIYFNYIDFRIILTFEQISFLMDELLVGSHFGDDSFLKRYNQVGVYYGLNPVSDADRSLSLDHSIKRILHSFLVDTIKGRCCFIKKKDSRLYSNCACNRHPLLLPSRNMRSLYTYIFC